MTLPFSLLDLAPVPDGVSTADALRNTLDLARHVDDLGYTRYWLAEHHNMPGIASSATAVMIGQVAAVTKTMRIGSGGIMLPNHAPLMVAEAFGTLASLYPNRIDLGLGRAPGTDGLTMRALRRNMGRQDTFVEDVQELIGYFTGAPGASVRAIPGRGTDVAVWMLGSSLYGAELAAMLGLPYAFASHFAPDALDMALAVYRQKFRPSAQLKQPHFVLAMNCFAADSDDEAAFLRTSQIQAFANLRSGRPGKLPKPGVEAVAKIAPAFRENAEAALSVSAVGARDRLRADFDRLIDRYQPDELILSGPIWDHAARKRSFEIAAEVLS